MNKLFAALLICASPLLVNAQSLKARSLSAPSTKDIAFLSEEVLLTGEATTTVSVAPLTTSSSGFGIKKLTTKLPGSPFGGMPVMSIANPTSQAAAMSEANTWLQTEFPNFKTKYTSWMRTQGLSTGFFNFSQEIMVATDLGPKKKAVAFNVTLDSNGRPTYGAPKIIDPDPTIVEAVYTPLATAAGLPATWQYPDAGKIKWRILDKKYQPLSGWKLVDTAGAFDQSPTEPNPDAKLACLMDLRNPGCAGPVDINKLMDQAGAAYALVSYIRKLEPDYVDDGKGGLIASSAISVDERTYDCTSYTNKGHYGFVLALMADQYMAQQTSTTLAYNLVQKFGGRGISPTEPYEKVIPVAALRGVHPDTVIINPTPNDDTLWSRSNADLMKNVLYVAPVVALGGDGQITEASFSGDMAVREQAASPTSHDYYIGTVGDNYWGSGLYDRQVTFNLVHPETTEMFSLIETGFDDWLLVQVNGTTVYIGPRGGNMLEIATGVTETDCTPYGNSYSCTHLSSTYTGSPYYSGGRNGNGVAVCPSGSSYGIGPLPGNNWGGTNEGYGCFASTQVTYPFCSEIGWGGHNGNGVTGYSCTQGCYPGMVQYLSGASGGGWFGGAGCGSPELGTNWVFSPNIDLRPYLKHGQNTLFMRTIVAGNGESWLRIRTRMCGSSLNLDLSAPPVPATAGSTGVTNSLNNQAK